MYNIGIIGLWHLGCVLSVSWSKLGNEVISFDYDDSLIHNLNNSVPPIYEPELEENIRESLDIGSLHFSSDMNSLSKCDFIFIAYDTTINDDDMSDMTLIDKCVNDVRNVMKEGAVLIISSQLPVGYSRKSLKVLKEKNEYFEIAYSPENLRLGEAIKCYLEPGRIILGTTEKATEDKCKAFFGQITDNILSMGLESSELVKHGINSFLATSLVFSNNLADICETKDADILDVIDGMMSDPRIGEKAYLLPGIGFSGGTLGRDLKVLSEIAEAKSDMFGIIYEYNENRKFGIIEKIENIMGRVEGKKIGVLGLTYKPGTSTLRRSRPLEIVNLLLARKAFVSVFDPKADYSDLQPDKGFKISKNIEEVAKKADILLLLTEWSEFKEYDWSEITRIMKNNIFFDTKNFLDSNSMKNAGFKFYSIGRK